VLTRFEGLKVDLTAPELVVWVEIWEREAAIYADKVPGPGGLAVGSSGKVLCLISGGIDSPVAAYLMMTRGAEVAYLYFHSFPFIGEQSKEKVHELVRHLARYQPRSRLHVAPFAKAQESIRDHGPEGLRTVMYRRMMNRAANRVAEREGALALVTGESLGQVASQTLPNIRAIQETAELPVLQPLIGMSKSAIIDLARRIGTYPISIQPFPDCCTLFQPRHPDTRAKPERIAQYEAHMPVDDLVAECVGGIETTEYGPLWAPAGWE
jgi:thiamine biosynthesis protein ThiI